MSLDVHLNHTLICPHCKKEAGLGEEVFWRYITHNLNTMADAAGLYKTLWRPEEEYIEYANQAIPHLEIGLAKLKSNPEKYRALNPANGWGNYEGLVEFVEVYLSACKTYPSAKITISR